ncbi:hypothetical protein JW964_28880 [candidate division KSB1 bacterium]|nr:hypothetical protein [candidate division KSB1 bacterium]
MTKQKKHRDLSNLASSIKEINSQLAQLTETEISQLKKLIESDVRLPLQVKDAVSDYFAAITSSASAISRSEMLNARISLAPFQLKILRDELEKQKISLDELVQNYVLNFIEEPPVTSPAALADFESLIGIGHSGETDISINHDYYFGEALAKQHLR